MLALVALPPEFGGIVGAKGSLFILAGCSPSNHEGRGQPPDLWAVYDIATSGYTIGKLPAATGAGTSACRPGDRLIIKRGGVHEREATPRCGSSGPSQLMSQLELERNSALFRPTSRPSIEWRFSSNLRAIGSPSGSTV